MTSPVIHFEIMGKDAAATQKFYADLFGWQIIPAMPEYGLINPPSDSRGIGGGIGGNVGGPETYGVVIYVEVDDLQATLAKAESMGGKTLMPPDQVPGGPEIAQFTDPDGNRIGLVKKGSMANPS